MIGEGVRLAQSALLAAPETPNAHPIPGKSDTRFWWCSRLCISGPRLPESEETLRVGKVGVFAIRVCKRHAPLANLPTPVIGVPRYSRSINSRSPVRTRIPTEIAFLAKAEVAQSARGGAQIGQGALPILTGRTTGKAPDEGIRQWRS
jgi:hypothetical protein